MLDANDSSVEPYCRQNIVSKRHYTYLHNMLFALSRTFCRACAVVPTASTSHSWWGHR